MKQLVLLLQLCMFTLISHAQTPIANYPFSGNANDAVGTLNGTVNGATLTADRFGNANSAYSFDGVDDFISTANIATNQTDNWTMTAWVKPASISQNIGTIVLNGFDNGITGNGYAMVTGGNLFMGLLAGVVFVNSGFTFSTNNIWYYTVIVREVGITKLYFNGVLSGTTSANSVNTPSGTLLIGSTNGIHFWNGAIDEVKIYNTALTAAQVQSEYNASSNGLIAYYPFTGNANDAVGTNNGTVNGATLTTDRFGNANSAYSFNGTSANINLGASATLRPTAQITYSVWFLLQNPAGALSGRSIFSCTDDGGYNIWYDKATNNLQVFLRRNGSYAFLQLSATPYINMWTHATITYDGQFTKLYINGTLVGTNDAGAVFPIQYTNTINTYIGADPAASFTIDPNYYFEGKIDEVKIYNTALTAAQVQNDYLQSGYGSQFGNSVQMNGTNDYIQPPALLNGATQFTIEYWINTAESRSSGSFSQNPTMIGNEVPGASSGEFSIYSNNGFIGMWGELNSGTQNFLSNKKINDNRWHHIAASNDGTNVNLFADGIFVGNIPSGNGLSTTSFPLRIGANNPASIGFVPHQGTFDEVRFWNTARTQTQIVANMNSQLAGNEASLVAYYDMNRTGQGASLTVENKCVATGAALNGTTVGTANTPIFAPGAPQQKPGSGNAISFDGVDSYVQLAQSLDGATQFTTDFWIKTTESGNSGTYWQKPTIMGNVNPGGNDGDFGITINNGMLGVFHGLCCGDQALQTTKVINDNKWHHITVVNNGSIMVLIVDGIQLAGSIPTNGGALQTAARPWRIGMSNSCCVGQFPFNGTVDEVRIWNTALTQTQIRDRMCRKITSSDALYNNLVAYYNFDESTGTTAFDATLNANNGTLTNAPTRVTSGAAVGNASSHDYVNAIKTTSLTHPTGESFTVTSSAGNPDGIQVYRVDEQPNTLSGTTGVGTNNKYFGVFQVNGTAPTYQALYNYTGHPGVIASNEFELRLNKRTDNSSTSWSLLIAIANEPANTITVSGESTEYILGKVGAALPLQLISFTGNKINADAQLHWATAIEINVAKYELQRSDDGNNFVTVGSVLAGGNKYTFIDAAIFATKQTVYYRIKMIDKNGSITFSNIIKLSNHQNITLGIYPNPVKNMLTVSGLKQKGTLRLSSAEGKIIYQQIVTTQAITINMSGYAKGLYVLQYQNNGEVVSEKISKQ